MGYQLYICYSKTLKGKKGAHRAGPYISIDYLISIGDKLYVPSTRAYHLCLGFHGRNLQTQVAFVGQDGSSPPIWHTSRSVAAMLARFQALSILSRLLPL